MISQNIKKLVSDEILRETSPSRKLAPAKERDSRKIWTLNEEREPGNSNTHKDSKEARNGNLLNKPV